MKRLLNVTLDTVAVVVVLAALAGLGYLIAKLVMPMMGY